MLQPPRPGVPAPGAGQCRTLLLLLVLALARTSPGRAQAAVPPASVRQVEVVAREGTWLAGDVSPDGHQVVFDLLGQLWLLPAAGGEARALTNAVADMADDTDPVFAPDGRTVYFAGERAGHAGLWQVDVATGAVRRLTTPPLRDQQPAPAPDGRQLAFVREVAQVDGERIRGFEGLHLLDLSSGTIRLLPFGDSGRASCSRSSHAMTP